MNAMMLNKRPSNEGMHSTSIEKHRSRVSIDHERTKNHVGSLGRRLGRHVVHPVSDPGPPGWCYHDRNILRDILREIHEGVCGNHAASRTLVGKAYKADFWWPTAVTDVEDLVRRCQNCQFFGKQTHVPAHSLITIPPSWPFACWSLDMIGPFMIAPGGFTHVLVAIDKFTKWIEYKPIAKLTPDRVVDFISDILHRFGFPNTIITDLGSNFTANQFWEFCENACIEVKYARTPKGQWTSREDERLDN
jgi:hypothetical protein